MITSLTLCGELRSAVIQMEQWAKIKCYRRAAQYKDQAETLLELLEVDLCGSVSGFARGQSDRTFEGRVKWVLRAYEKA